MFNDDGLIVGRLEAGNTPLPTTLPLFVTGLGLVGLLARRRKQRHAAALP
jgi:hypothetical protein